MSFRVAFIAGATANDDFRGLMALSEYDGLFIDPENLRDPDPALLSKRREEIEILLSAGGVVVVFARPLVEIGAGVDNYSWLLSRPFEIVSRSGTSLRISERENPFLAYFDAHGRAGSQKPGVHFQVVFRGIPADLPGQQILAENKVGETIGLLYRELSGTVALLPPVREIDEDFRAVMSEAMQQLRGRRSSIELAPRWCRELDPLPGEAERLGAIDRLEAEIDARQERKEEERTALEDLRGLKALLWETGSLGLEPAVAQALGLLGFEVTSSGEPDAHSVAIELRDGQQALFCEIDGSDEAIQLDGFRRLHDGVTEALLERGVEARGLLVGNGYRLTPLNHASRAHTFSESCISGCQKFGYGAVVASDLYRAVARVLGEPENEALRQELRQSLMDASGLWSLPGG